MRWFVILAVLVLAQLADAGGAAASCAREDFALAVDRAGAALRQLNADNVPAARQDARAQGGPRLAGCGLRGAAYAALRTSAWPRSTPRPTTCWPSSTRSARSSLGRARLRQAAGADRSQPGVAGDGEGQGRLYAGQARSDDGGPALAAGAQEHGRRVQQPPPVQPAPKPCATA